MKYNLKNRPKPPSFPTIIMKYYPIAEMYEEYFEGFERELKEKLKELSKSRHLIDIGKIHIIKEILGEKE